MLPDNEEMAAMAQAAGLEEIDIQDGPFSYLMTAGKTSGQ